METNLRLAHPQNLTMKFHLPSSGDSQSREICLD